MPSFAFLICVSTVMTCLLLYYRILQQSGILARCILFCFVAFHRIYMYVFFFLFFATTSLMNKDLYINSDKLWYSGRRQYTNAKMMMTMTSTQSKLLLQLNKFYNERVQSRRASVAKNMRDVCAVVQDVLKEVETQEPRFVSSLTEINGHYEGLQVCVSPLALLIPHVQCMHHLKNDRKLVLSLAFK